MVDSEKKRQLLSLLDSLDEHLDSTDGESMKGMPLDDEDDDMPSHESEEGPAALVVEVGAPKDGPPKPPSPPPGGDSGGDAMSVIQAALKSNDPAVKAAAEAFMKTKGG